MMSKNIARILLICILMSLCVGIFTGCDKKDETLTLYVYNWGEYISDGSDESVDTNAEFEKYCKEVLGITVKVNYSTFASNESMYAKVSSGSTNYDVIIPSDYMIERMIKEDMLEPLDVSKIPNYQYIDEAFKGENIYYECDSENLYSVPYFYGMIGVIYNTSIVDEDDEQIGSWDLMWDEQYKGDILQFNNSRDAFGTAQYKLGLDVNNEDEALWRLALEELLEQKKIVQGYVMDEIFNKMQSGSAAIAAYYAGDYLSMYENNEDLAFFYPQEGTNSYIDAMCIPKNAENKDLAHEYINFMCSHDIAMANALYTYYASPVTTVVEDPDYQDEMGEYAIDILYNQAQDVPSQAYLNLSPEALSVQNILWEELKAKSSIGNGIYIGCGIILGVLAGIGIYQLIKKRRWAKLYD